MALADRVTERLSTSRLAALTRPDSSGLTTVDTALLALACTDAEAEFRMYADVEYDESNARHVALAVQAVELVLGRYSGRSALEEYQRIWERWIAACHVLSATTSTARVQPETTSALTPSVEAGEGQTVRPDFDRTRFTDLIPGCSSNGAASEFYGD